jgi:hypothetical protein
MGVQVTFNYQQWAARYSEFDTVPEPTVLAYAAEAQVHHRNDGSGPVEDPTVQLVLLNMMTAHVAKLYATVEGQKPSGLVGRVSAAATGPISVSLDPFSGVAGAQQWLLQTQYGASYWAATAPYRRMRYRVGPQRNFDAPYPYGLLY